MVLLFVSQTAEAASLSQFSSGPLKVYGADGTALGYFALDSSNRIGYVPFSLVATGNFAYASTLQDTSRTATATIFFSSVNCAGTAFAQVSTTNWGWACTGVASCETTAVVSTGTGGSFMTYQSYRGGTGTCTNSSSSMTLYPTTSYSPPASTCYAANSWTFACKVAP